MRQPVKLLLATVCLVLSVDHGLADNTWRPYAKGMDVILGGRLEIPAGEFAYVDADGTEMSTVRSAKKVPFVAVRFLRTKYRLELTLTKPTIDSALGNKNAVKVDRGGGQDFAYTVDYTLEEMSSMYGSDVPVIAPIGWAYQAGLPQPVGYTRVDGYTVSPLYGSPGLSAIFCFDYAWLKEREGWTDTQFNIATYFEYAAPRSLYWSEDPDTSRIENHDELEMCRDFIQIGPRVIEMDHADAIEGEAKIGITRRSVAEDHKFRWTVFANDATRERYYIVSFLQPIALYDIAKFLSSDDFYQFDCGSAKRPGARSCEHWAVAMTGERYSGLALRSNRAGPGRYDIYGNSDTVIPAVMVVRELEE